MASVYKRKGAKPGSRWLYSYVDEHGKRRTGTGYTDKRMTEQRARELEDRARARADGLVDAAAERFAAEAKRPIGEHIADYQTHLESKRNSPKHVQETIAIVRDVAERCSWQTIAKIEGNHLAHDMRRVVQDEKRAARTANKRRIAVRGFTRWLWREGRKASDPLASVSAARQADDTRRQRRDYSDAELSRLFAAAEGAPVRGLLCGADRAALYRTACGTGLRASELLSLTPESFDLDRGLVTVRAGYSKRRRQDTQPLPPELVQKLTPWLAGKEPDALLWPTTSYHRAPMIRADLADARRAWETEVSKEHADGSDFLRYTDAAGRVADFHALRHSYITRLQRAGIAPKMAQTLARHSTIDLTMNVYTHVGLADPTAAVQGLPAIEANPHVLAATGTEGAQRQIQRTGGSVGLRVSSSGRDAGGASERAATTEPRQMPGFGNSGHGPSTVSPTRRSGGTGRRSGFKIRRG